MIAKTFEIRDRATFIPAIAVRLTPGNETDRYLLARAGYGRYADEQMGYVLLCRAEGNEVSYDPYYWADRTLKTAHEYILENFDKLDSGAVVDVEFILGEKKQPAESEST